MLARSKINSIESKIYEALINNEIMTMIDEERNYRKLKESITMMKSEKSDTEKN